MMQSHFGYNLRQLRRKAGLSQVALAARAGIANTTLCQYEREHQEPRVRIAYRLAVSLGTSMDTLCTERIRSD